MNKRILAFLLGVAWIPRWVGPGGESVLQQKDGAIIVFHAYHAQTGRPFLQISSLAWVKGWPQATLDQDSQSKGH